MSPLRSTSTCMISIINVGQSQEACRQNERRLISRCLGGCMELCSPGHSTPKKKSPERGWISVYADQKLLSRGGTAQVILERWGGGGGGLIRAHGGASQQRYSNMIELEKSYLCYVRDTFIIVTCFNLKHSYCGT